MTAKRKRDPRTPVVTGLPTTFSEAEEAEIIDTLEQWYVRLADPTQKFV